MDRSVTLEDMAGTFESLARATNKSACISNRHSEHIASWVNAALSIELFAKCLAEHVNGKYLPTHDLKKILDELSVSIRSDLLSAFDDQITDEAKENVKRLEKESGVSIGYDFESIISNWSLVFVKGRYWFENQGSQGFHALFFDELIAALKQEIEKQKRCRSS